MSHVPLSPFPELPPVYLLFRAGVSGPLSQYTRDSAPQSALPVFHRFHSVPPGTRDPQMVLAGLHHSQLALPGFHRSRSPPPGFNKRAGSLASSPSPACVAVLGCSAAVSDSRSCRRLSTSVSPSCISRLPATQHARATLPDSETSETECGD